MEDSAAVMLATSLDKVRIQTSSTLAHQKRPATLLLAVETTLTAQGTALAPVAYFAALVSTTQQLLNERSQFEDGSDQFSETLSGALYLLALVLPCTEQAVIRSRMDSLLEFLAPLLLDQADQAGSLKSLFTILQAVYLAMDGSTLSLLSSKQIFNTLIAFIVDGRPKVRRKAQDTILALLANPPAPALKHPYANRIAEFVLETLKEALKQGKKGGKQKAENGKAGKLGIGAANDEATRAIALCSFIRSAGKDWPADAIAPLCKLLLSLPRLGNTFLTSAAYDILEMLFSKSSQSFEDGKVEETLGAVLAARPNGSGTVDELILPGWLGTVEHGFVAFARINPEGCTHALLSTFIGIMGYLTSPVPSVRIAATSTLNALIRYCITTEEIDYSVKLDSTSTSANQDDSLHPLRAICENLLASLKNIRYQAIAMPHILIIVSSLILRLRSRTVPSDGKSRQSGVSAACVLLSEHIKLAGHLRGIEGFEYSDAAELVLGSATEVAGPEWMLSLLPLNLDEQSNRSASPGRAWLLPIFKGKITNTRLKHFTSFLVPLSEKMFGKFREAEMKSETVQEEAEKKRAGIEAKVYEAIVQQIWALFPGYCDLPVDLSEAFTKHFCEILSNVLYSQAHLRPPIFRGLQLLVERNKAIQSSSSTSDILLDSIGVDAEMGRKNIQLLSSLASSLLAVMFNVFSKAGKEGRGFVLDCISAYLGILDNKDLVGTYQKIHTLLLQALEGTGSGDKPSSSDATVPQTMLDLLVQLVPFLPDLETAVSLLKLVLSEQVLQSKDTAIQKKAYRVMVRLCEAGGSIGQSVIRSSLEDIIEVLVERNTRVAVSARKDRTTLLGTLVPLLPDDKLHIIPSIIPEAVLATKEANEVARGAAYDLLVVMGVRMNTGGTVRRSLIKGADIEGDEIMADNAHASIQEYITMVAAGLAGASPHMISATITALSRLLFEYHTQLPSDVIGELCTTILVFLGSANREIVKSSIGFVKVAVVSLSAVDVRPHLPKLVPSLLAWSHEHRNHFKLNIRHILERLIRKFGYEEIDHLTGENDRKLIASIKKRQMRAKRKKDQTGGGAAESDGQQAVKPRSERNAYEDALYGSEEEEDESEEETKGVRPLAGKGKRVQLSLQQQQQPKRNAIGRRKGQQEGQGSAYIRESDDQPLDLLDEKIIGRISRNDPVVAEARRTKRDIQASGTAEDQRGYGTDLQSGKLVFKEDTIREERPTTDEMRVDGDSTNAYLEAIQGEDGFRRDARGKVKFNKSTKRAHAQMEEDALLEDVKDRLAGFGVENSSSIRPKKQKKVAKESIGGDFKAKKAGGDVKKAGGPNPYAYVPLGGNGKKRQGLSIVGKGKRK